MTLARVWLVTHSSSSFKPWERSFDTFTGHMFQLPAYYANMLCVPAQCTSFIRVTCSSSLHIMNTGHMFQLTAHHTYRSYNYMFQLSAHHANRSYNYMFQLTARHANRFVCSSSLHIMPSGHMFQLTAHHAYRSHVPAHCSDAVGENISLTGDNMFQLTAHHAYRSHVPAHCTSCKQVACSSSLHIMQTGRMFQFNAHHANRSHVPAHCTSC